MTTFASHISIYFNTYTLYLLVGNISNLIHNQHPLPQIKQKNSISQEFLTHYILCIQDNLLVLEMMLETLSYSTLLIDALMFLLFTLRLGHILVGWNRSWESYHLDLRQTHLWYVYWSCLHPWYSWICMVSLGGCSKFCFRLSMEHQFFSLRRRCFIQFFWHIPWS